MATTTKQFAVFETGFKSLWVITESEFLRHYPGSVAGAKFVAEAEVGDIASLEFSLGNELWAVRLKDMKGN